MLTTMGKVYELSSDSSANVIGICDEAGIVFQTNSSGSVYYVNGNPIDISYYDYAVGSNSLTFTRRYPSMTLYKYGN